MNRQQAMNALIRGEKIKHRLFGEGEYVYMRSGMIIDESGIVHLDFWELRREEHWETDWEIVEVKEEEED